MRRKHILSSTLRHAENLSSDSSEKDNKERLTGRVYTVFISLALQPRTKDVFAVTAPWGDAETKLEPTLVRQRLCDRLCDDQQVQTGLLSDRDLARRAARTCNRRVSACTESPMCHAPSFLSLSSTCFDVSQRDVDPRWEFSHAYVFSCSLAPVGAFVVSTCSVFMG